MIMKMKKLMKGQRGFTLIELLLVIGLTGLIAGGLNMTVMQLMTMSHGTANRMTAVRQVQQVGFWVSPDVQMAEEVDPENNPYTPELLTLTWTEFGVSTNYSHEVIYTLEDMPSGEFKILWREHYSGPDPDSLSLESTIKVAEYIDDTIDPNTGKPKTNCEIVVGELGDELVFTVTATVGLQSETKVYKIKPRPGT